MGRSEKHPLLGAELRADRAARVIQELRASAQAWADAYAAVARIEQESPGAQPEIAIGDPDPRLLAETSVLIGDTVYNLRAALDYIVYAIAVTNNDMRHVSGTQFPIEDSEPVFEARRSGVLPSGKSCGQYLRCIPDGTVELIKELQPFAGCEWTRTLRELSNPDKHRTLTAVKSRGRAVSEARNFVPVTLDDGSSGHRVELRVNIEVEVFFSKGGDPVIETLETLQREVAATVDFFDAGFKSRSRSFV